VALLCARPLNLLQLGDEMAEGLGLRVVATRGLLGLVAAGLVAAVVAVCGPIGWIALLAPHLTRQALGTSDARRVLPLAALIGAMLLLAADLLGRVLFAPVELPVGIWTTLVGGPVLLFLLRHTLRGKR
jgi:iron complex transport system permease protein